MKSRCYATESASIISTQFLDRLQWLCGKYEAARILHPEIFKDNCRSFPEEIARLLARYKDGQSHLHCKINASSQAMAAKDIMAILRTGFGIDTERFSSPLTIDLQYTTYWSLHPEDRIFGARVDAYTCKWQGASQAHPIATSEEMEKAMRWAIASATHTVTPTLTALILPNLPRSAYAKWLLQPCVHTFLKLGKSDWGHTRHDAYKGHLVDDRCASKYDNILVIIANQQGISRYMRVKPLMDSITLALHRKGLPVSPYISNMIPSIASYADTNSCQTGAARQFRAPREFLKAEREAKANDMIPLRQSDMQDKLTSSPLRYNWRKLVYTDGSCQKTENNGTRTGAAVYNAADDTTVLVHTGGTGGEQYNY